MNQLDQTTYTTPHTHTPLLGATIQQLRRRLREQQKRILYEPRSGARSSSQLVQHSRGIDDNIHSFDQTADDVDTDGDADDDGDDFHYGPGSPDPVPVVPPSPRPSELHHHPPPSTGRPPKRSPKPSQERWGSTKTYCQSSSNRQSNYGNIIDQQQQHEKSQQQHYASLH
ncbi:LOW QUALITY PROTEIN: uncharacterized protein Dsimw501_GD13523 [Drosophila simulans]|uniref:Uncharacterized protein n=1 Tax=Drosophila simulans TaxID=7240 RepID=A0A0J9RLQ9_DROSI|nr:LOW QUALITY PROTEIN: uncharacterized protein Dsimw501_GD13523 [Drosophila simulans]